MGCAIEAAARARHSIAAATHDGEGMQAQNSKRRVALISAVTGEDGANLAEYLLGLGYTVHSINRHSSSFNTARVDHLYQDTHVGNVPFLMHYGDMTESTNDCRHQDG